MPLRALRSGLLALLLASLGAFAQEGSESLEREARKALNGGDFRRAALKFESAAAAAGEPARRSKLLLQASWSYFNQGGKTREAQDALRRAYTANADLDVVAEFFSPDFMRLVEEVKAATRVVPTPQPADLSELKRIAKEKLADGQASDVIHDLTYSIPREKLDAEALEILATAYEKQGRFSEASKLRQSGGGGTSPRTGSETLTATPGPLPTPTAPPPVVSPVAKSTVTVDYLALGRSALARGDALNAQAAANRLLELEPSSSEAYRLLGEALLVRGEKGLGEANLKQSLRYNEKNEATLLALYDYFLAEKNWDSALQYLGRAAELNPENRERLLGLGRRARGQGDLPHARQVYAAAATALPNDVSALTEYAGLLLQMKDTDAALEPLMKAAAVEPGREIVRANLAAVLRKKGLLKEAEREYRESLRSDPDYLPALVGLGKLLLEKQSPADAVIPLKRAVTLDPRNVEATLALARAQRQAGDLAGAADTLQRGREIGDDGIWNEAGVVAYERGQYPDAVESFDKALAKQPSSPLYKANRDRAAGLARFVKDAAPTTAAR